MLGTRTLGFREVQTRPDDRRLLLAGAAALGVSAFGALEDRRFDDPARPRCAARRPSRSTSAARTTWSCWSTPAPADIDGAAPPRPAGADRGPLGGPRRRNVVSYWTAPTARAAFHRRTPRRSCSAVLGDDNHHRQAHRPILLTATPRTNAAVTVQAGGEAAVNHDVTSQVAKDLALAEAIAVPMTMLLLILAFGSLVAALLPLAIGLFADPGHLRRTGDPRPAHRRVRLRRQPDHRTGPGPGHRLRAADGRPLPRAFGRGPSVDDARRAARCAPPAAPSLSRPRPSPSRLAALLVFPLYFLRSFAYAGIGVVRDRALAARLIIMPALLSRAGPGSTPWRLPGPAAERGSAAPAWGRIAAAVMRRPALIALPVVAVLLLLASAAVLHVRFGTPDERGPARPGASPAGRATPAHRLQRRPVDRDPVVTPGPATRHRSPPSPRSFTLPRGARASSAGVRGGHDGLRATADAGRRGYSTST